jgi:hypothetical protein
MRKNGLEAGRHPSYNTKNNVSMIFDLSRGIKQVFFKKIGPYCVRVK